MLRVWLQMLSVSDRNEGEIRGDRKWIERGMGSLWNTNSKRYNTEWKSNQVRLAFDWMANKGWIRIESDRIIVCNYLKYHISRDVKQIPPGKRTVSLPSEPSEPSLLKDPINPLGRPVDKSEPDPEKKPKKGKEPWRPFADKIYQSDKQRFARIPAFINWTRKKGYSETVVTQGLARLFAALEKGLVVDEWWPYAKKLCEKAYTEEQQGQSSNYKKGGVESLRQVFNRIKKH